MVKPDTNSVHVLQAFVLVVPVAFRYPHGQGDVGKCLILAHKPVGDPTRGAQHKPHAGEDPAWSTHADACRGARIMHGAC